MSAEPINQTSAPTPPALTLLPNGFILQAPNGEVHITSLADIVSGTAVVPALLWANLLVQKDLAERTAMMAQAVGELARAMTELTKRASQPVNMEQSMRHAMDMARSMLHELKPQGR